LFQQCLYDLQTLSASTALPYSASERSADENYVLGRVAHEGWAFFTETLPRLGKAYDRFLSKYDELVANPGMDSFLAAQIGLFEIEGFKPYCRPKQFTYPRFFRYYGKLIESQVDPLERAPLIRVCRTILFLFYKIEQDVTPEVAECALTKWYETEAELGDQCLPVYYDDVATFARGVISRVTANVVFDIAKCQHGPGAVAGGEKGDEKWVQPRYSRRLHRVLPWYDTYFGWRSTSQNTSLAGELIEFHKNIEWVEDWTSRLLFVPKDSRGPRVISCEPKELMFLQQGLRASLQPEIERMTSNRVNFLDQTINQDLAKQGSVDGSWATIDLSDASDRVSCELVRLLWDESPVHDLLFHFRSTLTELPNGEKFRHSKFAPMGSALCFPVEALTFYAICVGGLMKLGVLSPEEKVYVYGDDIIVPTEHAYVLMQLLERFGLKVNREKSYTSGSFRESCGYDAWHGHCITPQKIRKHPAVKPGDGLRLVAWCDYASNFNMEQSMFAAGDYCRRSVEYWCGFIPYTLSTTSGLTIRHPWIEEFPQLSKDTRTQRLRFKGITVKTAKARSTLSGLSRLNKWAYGSWVERDPSFVVLPQRTQIKRGWVYLVD
jgi:hypothetical protein